MTLYKVISYIILRYSEKYQFSHKISDKWFLKLRYRRYYDKKLDLKNPQTFSQKLQWLKLYDRDPLYTKLVDKYEAKLYVASLIGERYIIPTLGIWDNFDDIDFSKLPDKFVLKCTHDSGGLIICKDKSKLDLGYARKKISTCLKRNYYWDGREWPYKDLKPRILCEEYMANFDREKQDREDLPSATEQQEELSDYKFFCFDGEVKLLLIVTGRFSDNKCFDFFDKDFNRLDIQNQRPNNPKVFEKPSNYKEMVEIAEKLSVGFKHIRIDLYNSNGKIYFGEYTFYHDAGFTRFTPEKWSYTLGSWIRLNNQEK